MPFLKAKEIEVLTKKVSGLNKTLRSKDTEIIDLEQKLEEANRQVNLNPIYFRVFWLVLIISRSLDSE